MSILRNLPNIGKVEDEQLNSVGIRTFEVLKEIGSRQVWLKLKNIDDSSCINKLYALEGAIQGIRWHDLSKDDKEALKDFYNAFSN